MKKRKLTQDNKEKKYVKNINEWKKPTLLLIKKERKINNNKC